MVIGKASISKEVDDLLRCSMQLVHKQCETGKEIADHIDEYCIKNAIELTIVILVIWRHQA